MNLLTIADGFGDSVCGPDWYPDYLKWPEIIKFMTQGLNLCNLSRYGAGNEYIIQCLRNNLANQDAVLIQWATPERLDLVLSHHESIDQYWQQEIARDPVYNKNIVQVGPDNIWISSASVLPDVQVYHSKFIGTRQHQIRSQLFVDYATLLLKDRAHGFLLTKTSHYLEESVTDRSNWYWHKEFQGMCEFRQVSKYADLDLGLTQPIPLIHFDFVRQFVQPRFNLPWRSERDILAVENMLYRKYKAALKNKPQ